MQMYTGQMYTPMLIETDGTEPYYTRSVWHVAECRCTKLRCNHTPLLIKPSGTEHYYTRWVWHVAECRCIQFRCYTPWLIKPSGTAPYYTRSKKTNEFKIYDEMYTYPVQMYPYPLLIDPSATESYYTMSVWHVTACRCTKVRCTNHPTPTHIVEETSTTSHHGSICYTDMCEMQK